MFGNGGTAQPVLHVLDENELSTVRPARRAALNNSSEPRTRIPIGLAAAVAEKTRRKDALIKNATRPAGDDRRFLAGMVWALEKPKAGIVEADEGRLTTLPEVQMPYWEPSKATYNPTGPRVRIVRGCSPRNIDETESRGSFPQTPGTSRRSISIYDSAIYADAMRSRGSILL